MTTCLIQPRIGPESGRRGHNDGYFNKKGVKISANIYQTLPEKLGPHVYLYTT